MPEPQVSNGRRAETGGAGGHGGTADVGGMWVLRRSLATLQGTAVAARPVASTSCCLLLHPALPLQHPGASSQRACAAPHAAPGRSGTWAPCPGSVPRQIVLSQRGNPLSSRLAPVRRGMPSGAGQVHASTAASLSHTWTDRQTEILPPPGVHLQPGTSSCLQLMAAVGGFLYINRAPKCK